MNHRYDSSGDPQNGTSIKIDHINPLGILNDKPDLRSSTYPKISKLKKNQDIDFINAVYVGDLLWVSGTCIYVQSMNFDTDQNNADGNSYL